MQNNEINSRKKLGEKILSSPENYKVCCGCDSIWSRDTIICDACKAYNFETDIDFIVNTVNVISNKPQSIILDYE